MSIIKVKCTDQVLAFENTPVIASGGREENFVQFSFCSQWNGYTRAAVFWRNEAEAYQVILGAGDSCVIPWEVLTTEGLLYFGVFGVNQDNRRRTTEVLSYFVAKGAITENTRPTDPTPDIYNQLLARMAEVQYGTLTAKNISLPAATAEALGLNAEGATVDDAVLKLLERGGTSTGTVEGAVRYDIPQVLTDEQKARVRDNLGLTETAPDGGAVLYDTVQLLPTTQQDRARSNIGAVSAKDVDDAITKALGGYVTALADLDAVIGGVTV